VGGFATSNTRGSGNLAHELEERTKHLDVFTDEFSPPGSPRQTVPGQDVTKGVEYQKPHDDGAGSTDLPVNRRDRVERGMSAAGNAKDQKPLDDLDKEIQKREGQIKKPSDQFPMGKKGTSKMSDKKKAMSEADDDEAVNKEKAELRKQLKKLSGPDKLTKLNGLVETRLTKLAGAQYSLKQEELSGDWYLYNGEVRDANRIGGPYKRESEAKTALENQKKKDFKDAPKGNEKEEI
jgi:hypothetical protein